MFRIFGKFFMKFCELYRKSLKIISKNFEDFEKYFGHFREVLWKISRNIS